MPESLGAFLADFGYIALFVILLLDSVGVPIPTELSLLFAGYLVSTDRILLIPALLAAVAGAMAGSAISFAAGRRAGPGFLERFGRRLGIKAEHLERTRQWFHRHGDKAVCLGRAMPVVRCLLGWVAGTLGLPAARYYTYTLVGYGAWITVSVLAGNLLGGHYMLFVTYMEEAIALALVVVGAWAIYRFVLRRTSP